jgi:hypothetical protein
MPKAPTRRKPRFNERLRLLLTAAGIPSAGELAYRMARSQGDQRPRDELSVGGPARWLNGEAEPSVRSLVLILKLTKGNGHWLLTGQGDMFGPEPGLKEQAFDSMAAWVDRIRGEAAERALRGRSNGDG